MKKLLCLLLTLVFLCSSAPAEELEIPEMTDALIRDLNIAYSIDQYLDGLSDDYHNFVLHNVNFLKNGTPFFFTDEDTFCVIPTCGPSYALDGTLTESAFHNVLFILYAEDSWDDLARFIGYTLALRGGKAARDSGMDVLKSVRADVTRVNADSSAYYKVYDVCADTKLKVIVSGSEASSDYSVAEILLDFPVPWEYISDPEQILSIF